jgi:DNA-nicking Smr family endonuclease
VQPLVAPRRVHHPLRPVEPTPRQRQLDEQAVMREALSDDFDVETLLHTDEALSYRRPGLGPDVVRKLREGQWSIQRQIDLHGLRTDEAREALGQFVRETHQLGLRCVRVVHGKGLGSPGRTPVLKGRVLRWLVQKNEVLAFVQARPADGGAGALVVLLKPVGK